MPYNAVADAAPQQPVNAPRQRAAALLSRVPRWWPWALLALLLLVGAALLASEARGTVFSDDEWIWIQTRRAWSASTLLEPHNSHLSLVPLLVYKVLFSVVGLRHYWPYHAIVITAHLTCVTLVFLYARRRAGDYVGMLSAALILFFGPGWQNFQWPFQMAWLFAVSAGIGALLALEREDRLGDIAACVLVALSLGSAGPGLAVALGVLVEVALRRRPRQLWIPLVPIALYAVWALGYQQSLISAHALVLLPRFVFAAAGGALSSLAGLSDIDVLHNTGSFLQWGAPLLIGALVLLVWRLRRWPAIPRRVWGMAAVLLAFWLLTGIGRAYVAVGSIALTATGDESRYLYVSAVFIVLLAADVLRGARLSLPVRASAGVLVLAAIVSNVGTLRDAARVLQGASQVELADLATLDISRGVVAPGYRSQGFLFGILTARGWFDAKAALGSPLHDPAPQVLAAMPEGDRAAADTQLVAIQALNLQPPAGRPPAGAAAPPLDGAQLGQATAAAGCVSFRPAGYLPPGGTSALELTIPRSGLLIRAVGRSAASLGLRRFGDTYQPIGSLSGGAAGLLRPRPDLAPQRWHVQIQSATPVQACGLG